MIAAVLVVVIALTISLWYAGKMVSSLSKIREFLGNVAQGQLDCEIDENLIQRPDEIGEMGRSAKKLQVSILNLVGTDPLTGLYNRMAYTEMIVPKFTRYCREGIPCAMAFF